jgi:ATP-dependent Clp protease ATP-binding subunit ClpC
MFERYTENARRSIFFARYEASLFGATEINTEHFLLGLLREGDVCGILPPEAPELIRRDIQNETPAAPRTEKSIDMPLSHVMKRVLSYAATEATKLNHPHIGTGHQLLGLLWEPCLASRILNARGIDFDGVRAQLAGVEALAPGQAQVERARLHRLIDSLPDDLLREARRRLEQLGVIEPPTAPTQN